MPSSRDVAQHAGAVEQAEDDALAGRRRHDRHPHVDVPAADPQRDAAVLRQAALGDVEPGHDLHARHHGGVQPSRRREHVVQHAVDAQPDREGALEGLDVHVAGARPDRLVDDAVHQANGGRVLAGFQEVGRLGVVERRGVELEAGAEGRAVVGRGGRGRVVGARDRVAQGVGRDHQRPDHGPVEQAQVVERRQRQRIRHRHLETRRPDGEREHQVPARVLHRERGEQVARRKVRRRVGEWQAAGCRGLAGGDHPPGASPGACHERPRRSGLRRSRAGMRARSRSELSAI